MFRNSILRGRFYNLSSIDFARVRWVLEEGSWFNVIKPKPEQRSSYQNIVLETAQIKSIHISKLPVADT